MPQFIAARNRSKTRWTDEGEPLCRVIGYNRTVTGRLAYWLDAHVKPALRPLRNRFRVQHSGRAVNPEPQKDPR